MNLRNAEQWRRHAACKDYDTALFYPEHWSKPAAAAARAVCNQCPVRPACLAYALDNRDFEGMYGGKTPRQRRRISATNSRKTA